MGDIAIVFFLFLLICVIVDIHIHIKFEQKGVKMMLDFRGMEVLNHYLFNSKGGTFENQRFLTAISFT